MPVVAALRSPSPDVGPDEELVCELSVRNTGAIVDQFHLEVLGPAQDWTTLEPSVLSLFPNGQQVAQVKVRPPRAHTTPTGEIPLAVKVTPANDAGESVVEETVLNVAAFEDVEAELLPRISTGRISGRHRLAVDSRGNHPLTVKLSASDPANGLRIALTPPALVLQPGRASLARVKVRPRQRFYRGAIRQRPFKVAITPKDAEPVVVDGVFAQRPVLPKGVLILLVIAALVAAWFFLIKPAVHNTAVNAVSQPLTAQKAQNNALASGLQAANSNAAAAANKASAANSQAAAANGNAAAANKALAKIAAKPPPSVVTIPPAAPAAPAQINIPASKPPSVVVQTPT
ncbi:MAG: hypothetical protein ACRD0H_00510, partial [Actinomycetes bacterium]